MIDRDLPELYKTLRGTLHPLVASITISSFSRTKMFFLGSLSKINLSSIMINHRYNPRAQHEPLNVEVMLHWNTAPFNLADIFIKSSFDNYFFQWKDKHWISFKNEQCHPFKLVSPRFGCLKPLENRTNRKKTVVSLNRVGLRLTKNILGKFLIFCKFLHF